MVHHFACAFDDIVNNVAAAFQGTGGDVPTSHSDGFHAPFPAADDHVWTFAYGANIGQRKLDAANIHPEATLPASLPGHRLIFNPQLSVGPDEPAFADVEKVGETPFMQEGHEHGATGSLSPAQGVLHLVSKKELQRLDLTEGADRTESALYERVKLPVEVQWGGEVHTIPAWTYRSKHWPVKLVAEPILNLGLVKAWHTSLRIGDTEFVFDVPGIVRSNIHNAFHSNKQEMEVIDMGATDISPTHFQATLDQYFKPDTYDMLHKNCNSFTDVALAKLVGKRLGSQYRFMEKLASETPSLVKAAVGKDKFYNELKIDNPAAKDWDQEAVARRMLDSHGEDAPSSRYARLVYCGLKQRTTFGNQVVQVPDTYAEEVRQHLKDLGIPDEEFSCSKDLLKPRLDLGEASKEGQATVATAQMPCVLTPTFSQWVARRQEAAAQDRWRDFLSC